MFEDITDGVITDVAGKEDVEVVEKETVKATKPTNPTCPFCGSDEVGIDTSCGKFECFCIKCNQKWPF